MTNSDLIRKVRRINICIMTDNPQADQEIEEIIDEFTRTISDFSGNVEGLTVKVEDAIVPESEEEES